MQQAIRNIFPDKDVSPSTGYDSRQLMTSSLCCVEKLRCEVRTEIFGVASLLAAAREQRVGHSEELIFQENRSCG